MKHLHISLLLLSLLFFKSTKMKNTSANFCVCEAVSTLEERGKVTRSGKVMSDQVLTLFQ